MFLLVARTPTQTLSPCVSSALFCSSKANKKSFYNGQHQPQKRKPFHAFLFAFDRLRSRPAARLFPPPLRRHSDYYYYYDYDCQFALMKSLNRLNRELPSVFLTRPANSNNLILSENKTTLALLASLQTNTALSPACCWHASYIFESLSVCDTLFETEEKKLSHLVQRRASSFYLGRLLVCLSEESPASETAHSRAYMSLPNGRAWRWQRITWRPLPLANTNATLSISISSNRPAPHSFASSAGFFGRLLARPPYRRACL